MKRLYCTPAEKQALSEKQNGLCAICGEPLGLGRTEFDHSVPNAIRAGKPDQAIHAACHRIKTKVDRKDIAKVYRLIRKAIRRAKIRKMQGRPFSRKWKRKLDGTVVRRAAMTQPTDADRQRAREIAQRAKYADDVDVANLTDYIAAAIAAARAEGLEEAARVPDRLRSDWGGYDGDDACVACAAAIRALKESGHGK